VRPSLINERSNGVDARATPGRRSAKDPRYVVGKMDWSGRPKRFVLFTYHSHMILSKEALNGMTVASANGDTVVQIHVWQMQSGVLEWGCHTP
jgi:hypothetical protein